LRSSLAASKADVYQQISGEQVRQLLKEKPNNMDSLIRALVSQLGKFASSKTRLMESEQQQCITSAKLLTRVLPFIFENRESTFAENLFWNSPSTTGDEDTDHQNGHKPASSQRPLAQKLMDDILTLLFKPGFTCSGSEGGAAYWEGGTNGCMGPQDVPKSRQSSVRTILTQCFVAYV
jgi:hypothetical protein